MKEENVKQICICVTLCFFIIGAFGFLFSLAVSNPSITIKMDANTRATLEAFTSTGNKLLDKNMTMETISAVGNSSTNITLRWS